MSGKRDVLSMVNLLVVFCRIFAKIKYLILFRTTATRTNSLSIKDPRNKQVSNVSVKGENQENTPTKTTILKVTLSKPDHPSVELDCTTEVTQSHRISSQTGSEHLVDDDAFTEMVSESTPNICIPSQAEILELIKIKRDRMGGLGSRKSSICHALVRAQQKGRRHTQE